MTVAAPHPGLTQLEKAPGDSTDASREKKRQRGGYFKPSTRKAKHRNLFERNIEAEEKEKNKNVLKLYTVNCGFQQRTNH